MVPLISAILNDVSSNFSLVSFSDYLFKLLLIGDSGVGKSCLLLRFAVSIAECSILNVNFTVCWLCM